MGILLAFVSALLLYLFSPLVIIYGLFRLRTFKAISDYFLQIAISIDQLGNVVGAPLFNDLLRKKNGHLYGSEDETISSATGRNFVTGTLTIPGRMLRWILDRIQPNHCVNAIEK